MIPHLHSDTLYFLSPENGLFSPKAGDDGKYANDFSHLIGILEDIEIFTRERENGRNSKKGKTDADFVRGKLRSKAGQASFMNRTCPAREPDRCGTSAIRPDKLHFSFFPLTSHPLTCIIHAYLLHKTTFSCIFMQEKRKDRHAYPRLSFYFGVSKKRASQQKRKILIFLTLRKGKWQQ